MSELEIAKSQIVQLTTSNVLLRGEIVSLKEKLAKLRRARNPWSEPEPDEDYDDRTQAEIDREVSGEHEADLERSGH